MLFVKYLARHPNVLKDEDASFPIRWPDGLGARLLGLLPANATRTPPAELAAQLKGTTELWDVLREAKPLLVEHAGVLFQLAQHSKAEDAQFMAWPSDYAAHYEVRRDAWGEGAFGTVFKCTAKTTGVEYACKKIMKRQVESQNMKVQMLKNEVWTMLTVCKHPQIVDLVAVFETDVELVLIEESCTGGDLLERINELSNSGTPGVVYREREAAGALFNALKAIDYCHTVHNIIHRDIKAENFLLRSKGSDMDIVLVDFGFASISSALMQTRAGTLMYAAPEVFTSASYDASVDVWSLGIMGFLMMCGSMPFHFTSEAGLLRAAQHGLFDVRFPDPAEQQWVPVSDGAKSFLTSLIKLDPHERPIAGEAMRHPWFSEQLRGTALQEEAELNLPYVGTRLQRYVKLNKFMRVSLKCMAACDTEEETAASTRFRLLRAAYDKINVKGDGKISSAEWRRAVEAGLIPGLTEAMFASLDIDGSDALDFSEFLAAALSTRFVASDLSKLEAVFARFDARASGEISEADLVDSVRNNESLRRLFGDVAIGRPEAQKWLSEIDLDGSGAISFAEFRAYMLTQLHNYQTASPNSRAPAYATDGRGFFFAASASPSSSASPKAGFAGPAVIEEHEFRSPSSSADTRPGVCSVCGGHGGSHEGYCPLA